MTDREALKLALEALENNRYIIESEINPPEALEEFDVAIAVLRKALEQSDDAAWARYLKEPMSEKRVHKSDTMERECNPHPDAPHGFNRDASHGLGRYVCDCEGWEPPNVSQEPQTMPEKTDDVAQETQPEQEPVAWVLHRELFWPYEYEVISKNGDNAIPLYTTPPKREWVGLTDDETDILITLHAPPIHPDFNDDDDFIELVSAIEAKLKEKNT